jgi:hypothetical protein
MGICQALISTVAKHPLLAPRIRIATITEAFMRNANGAQSTRRKRWSSPLIESSTEVVAGVPQIIYEVPPDGSASALIADLDFTKVFDRLIIGPTPYP